MSLQLRLLNFLLPLIEKRYLSNMPSVDHARERFIRMAPRNFKTPPGVYFRDDTLCHEGHSVPVIVAEPGPVPARTALLYLHGGGYFMGSAETHKRLAGTIAQAAGLRAYVADFRLTPEHPFPAALEDAVAAYRAMEMMGITRIVIAGDSAGGGLALALLHVICTTGMTQPAATVALSPWADLTLKSPSLDRNRDSDVMLPRTGMEELVATYRGETPADDPRISPVMGDFTGAGPVLIQASQVEMLIDEAEAVIARMAEQGVDATLQTKSRTPHVWQLFHGFLPEADQAIASIAVFLRRHLA